MSLLLSENPKADRSVGLLFSRFLFRPTNFPDDESVHGHHALAFGLDDQGIDFGFRNTGNVRELRKCAYGSRERVATFSRSSLDWRSRKAFFTS